MLNIVQSLAEREKHATYKGLMQHLRCGAEIKALFSAQQATSFLPARSKCICFIYYVYINYIIEAGANKRKRNFIRKEQQDFLTVVHGAGLTTNCFSLIYTLNCPQLTLA